MALALALAILLALPRTALTLAEPPAPDPFTPAQERWIADLEMCESGGDPEAINPNDLDQTPSYGRFQFKPSTLDHYAGKYGVATTTVMDGAVQEAVLRQMVLHRDEIRWEREFPSCVRRLGLPPEGAV